MSAQFNQDHDSATGQLFGSLWGPYSDEAFEHSVKLFTDRLDLAGYDRSLVADKVCLDAGCGGGRNSIAMARLGARAVEGIDIGAAGIDDAKRRAEGLYQVNFQTASVENIPFPDGHFDLVWCAGVLMHTHNDERVLDELARVVRPGGQLYMLVYATGGMRWPLIQLLRPLAQIVGRAAFEDAVLSSGLSAAKRRTFLDDLFVPKLDFYHWKRLSDALEQRGFTSTERWGPQTRLDHEHSLAHYREDLEALLLLFSQPAANPAHAVLIEQGRVLLEAVVTAIADVEQRVADGVLTEQDGMNIIIGQGHHRLLATKGR